MPYFSVTGTLEELSVKEEEQKMELWLKKMKAIIRIWPKIFCIFPAL